MKENIQPRFGFVNFAETWNGRLAMMGILIGLTTELLTGQGILTQMGLGWFKLINVKEVDNWLVYNLPYNLLGKIWEGKYSGQKQKWFIMKFVGDEKEININTKNPEFLDWKWVNPLELPKIVVDFKISIYKKISQEIISKTKLNT